MPTYKSTEEEAGHLRSLFLGEYAWLFWTAIVGGLVVPVVVLIFPQGRKPLPLFVVSLAVVTGAWWKRYLIVIPTLKPPFPAIHERAVAPGFYLDDLAADSFGQRYVGEEGFAWMETRDIYRRDAHVRYRRVGGEVVREPAPDLWARYAVTSTLEVRARGIHVARTAITDRANGRLLAQAHSLTDHGGPLGMFLGVYGLSQCPDPRSPEGSRRFDTYYHLARRVLSPP